MRDFDSEYLERYWKEGIAIVKEVHRLAAFLPVEENMV